MRFGKGIQLFEQIFIDCWHTSIPSEMWVEYNTQGTYTRLDIQENK